jgi:hypothetical protein
MKLTVILALMAMCAAEDRKPGFVPGQPGNPGSSFGAFAQGADPASSLRLDVPRLRLHHHHLVSIAQSLPQRVVLTDVLEPMMRFAVQRATETGAPAEENRAAIVALASYVTGWPLELVVPEARTWPRAPRRSVVLRGRGDLAQHFALSAAIAAAAGTPLAQAAGLYKELDDARRGSGFSFSDLAADRAGTLFGDVATRSEPEATALQALAAAGLADDDIMPVVADLPDNLSEPEFIRRFGGVGGTAYNSMLEDITRRVAALRVFEQTGADRPARTP